MDDVIEALSGQLDELRQLVTGLADDDWSRPSACPGWTISDVLLHLAQTNEMASASAEGTLAEASQAWSGAGAADGIGDVDDLAGWAVERERGASAAAVFARWDRSAVAMVAALAAGDPARRVQWVAGDMAARTLATTRIAETWIHTGDVAVGLGVELAPTVRLWHIARLVQRTVPYAFVRTGRGPAGAVRFELTGPTGDTWVFGADDAPTVVRGTALDLCRVAGQRAAAGETDLVADGPDAAGVLESMRTFA